MLPNVCETSNSNPFMDMNTEELVAACINEDASRRVIELVQGWLQPQVPSSSVGKNGQEAQIVDNKRQKSDIIRHSLINNDSSNSKRGKRLDFLGHHLSDSNSNLGGKNQMETQSSENPPQSIYDFILKDAKGNDVNLSDYEGKVLLIVNVASKCGMTNSNYEELNQLYQKYKDQGLEILAFPCNQFGDEEPGSTNEIQDFVCTRFESAFPIFDKIEVNGENAAPLYKFLKLGKWGIFGDDIQWNFAKFLVDKSGHPVGRYYPTTSPLSLEYDIKKLLEIA